ncbi:dihydrolipoamide acetyltransferase family protein [Pollutimonas bauzanensis]|uniref:Dihydrolipoamide acetyltransferase component of pyruvate dehydrogenase complex n=1 Tax=Pollutimonas bauzanensis TaxID=658167 RepID=A0A1M5QG72_9BURK|nr:dihydrolipoamide acetyltransferase family protein [Pollutimonas bauzanensis]SHH13214.1 pyruvate dehydrogenase E2 component (dihydrolipoamide acetyltransferase) [Pollutimonas bauzanensis]
MATAIIMPSISSSTTEVILTRWLKKDGDTVAKGEIIAEIETDKAVIEVEAEAGGTFKPFFPDGATIRVGAPMGALLAPGETPSAEQPGCAPATHDDRRIFASPLARRLALRHGLDLFTIAGSGPQGRILKRDIEAAMEAQNPAANSSIVTDAPAGQPQPTPQTIDAGYELVPHSSMRRVIAQRLSESKQQMPHFYLTVDCRLDKLLALRQQVNGSLPGVKLSINDFIIKAVAAAMQRVPASNASWSDEGIRRYRDIDISLAVATSNGLITPVIRRADAKSVAMISAEAKGLAERARQGKLRPDEYQGGGFTISNLGMYGVRAFAAIINPPQACILAVGAAEKRPVVDDGEIVPAAVMTCTLSVDHRVVDGAVAAEFLAAFKALLETPLGLLV